ncbi:hypothetical protein ACN08Z_01200 [Rothia sp. P7181]|uniref:hypothetical protein n=1 Tax=Rothia sp. P7181 TaxID=3402663 RepID=UPI003ADC8894
MNSLSRRHIVRGAAWSVPVVLSSAVIPSYAASPCPEGSWYIKSRLIQTDEDPSNVNFDNVVTDQTTPPGESSMQHWYFRGKLWWRIPLGFPQGAEAGALVTVPFDSSWTSPSKPAPYPLAKFKAFGSAHPELFTQELPAAEVAIGTDHITISFPQEIPAGAAGGFIFTTVPVGGEEAVLAGTPYTAEAYITFKPLMCS